MAKEGLKRVEILGVEGKRQITAVFADTMTGDFLFHRLSMLGKLHGVCLQSSFRRDGI